MRVFDIRTWQDLEEIWHHNSGLAWSLALLGAASAIWALLKPQSPGVSIGLLALAAGIMSVRPKMHPAEKFVWVVILIVFAVLEVHAIKRTDEANQQAREIQDQKFRNLAESMQTNFARTAHDIATSYALSTKGFSSTLRANEQIMNEAIESNRTAKESLANITGGDTYLEAIFNGPGKALIIVRGKVGVYDASVQIIDKFALDEFDASHDTNIEHLFALWENVPLGLFLKYSGQEIRFKPMTPHNGVVHYVLNFFARSGNWQELYQEQVVNGKVVTATRVTRLKGSRQQVLTETDDENFPRDAAGKVDWHWVEN